MSRYISNTPVVGLGDSPPYKIAVCGLMHSGKSTIAAALEKRGYTRQAFAAPVKQFAANAVNGILVDNAKALGGGPWRDLTVEDLNQDKETYRVLFQWIGNYAREKFGEDYWIKLYEATYKELGAFRVVVDDLRYVNEGDFLRDSGYHIIRVERPEPERIESIQQSYEKQHGRRLKKKELRDLRKHPSEAEVGDIKVDRVIQNNGTILQLQQTLSMIVGVSF